MPKPKIAFYWCASCGGCEESVVDMAEAILELADLIEIVLWPVAMDFKKSDIEALDDGAIAATFLNGAIRTSEQEEMARLLRRKSGLLIAYGSCAHTGGIPALANQFSREQILQYVYHDAPSVVNPAGTEPQLELHEDGRIATLPAFRNVVRALDQVVDVDYYLPGCAPNPDLVLAGIRAILAGELPPKGTVLAPDVALCDHCPRIATKPADLELDRYYRTHLKAVDPDLCLLAQGFLCLGPATRSGCGERCIRGNMPCTGCFGPLSGVRDHGAKMLSAMASVLAAKDDAGIDDALQGIPDPVGSFYRYGMAASMLRRRSDFAESKKDRNG
jgi:F420-non-reducing hydrogenase small subunit